MEFTPERMLMIPVIKNLILVINSWRVGRVKRIGEKESNTQKFFYGLGFRG